MTFIFTILIILFPAVMTEAGLLPYSRQQSEYTNGTLTDQQLAWFYKRDIEHGFAKDKDYAFYRGKKIDGSNGPSFELLGDGYAKDKWYGYYSGKKVDGSNGPSFELTGDGYAKDKSNIYCLGKKINGVIVSGFQLLGEGYASDRSSVYYRGERIKDVSVPKSFELIRKS